MSSNFNFEGQKDIHLKNILYNIDFIINDKSGFENVNISFTLDFSEPFIVYDSFYNDHIIRHYNKISKQCLINFLSNYQVMFRGAFFFNQYSNNRSQFYISIK